MGNLGPWNRGDVLDLHIFILLLIWFTLDRSNIYFTDIWLFVQKLGRAWKQIRTKEFWQGK
jgi:hypothetical protein